MSCWLLTNPKEILEKIGDFSNIKVVAKLGARINNNNKNSKNTRRSYYKNQ